VDVLISGIETARWAEGGGRSGAWGVAGMGKHWRGWVYVEADHFDLSQPRYVTYDRGSAEYSGKVGLGVFGAFSGGMGGCIPFPYATGSTQARALGRATGEAISGVLNQLTGQKPWPSDFNFVHVEVEPASLHSEPRLDSTVVDKVWSAMALKVVKEKDTWLQVEAPSGKKGWIAKNWLVKDIQTESEILCDPTK